MPSVSKKQQRYFFAVKNCQDDGNCPSEQIHKTANSMSRADVNKFLSLAESFQEWLKKREKLNF